MRTRSCSRLGKMPPSGSSCCGRSSSRPATPVWLHGKAGTVSFGQGGAIWGPKRTGIPDFDRLVVRSRHDLGPVWGKRHRADVVAVGAGLLGLELQCGCEGKQGWSVEARQERFGADFAPESQTLIVLSIDPETIFEPSGENATDKTSLLWAFVFSFFSSSMAAREGRKGQFWARKGDSASKTHRNPRFWSSLNQAYA